MLAWKVDGIKLFVITGLTTFVVTFLAFSPNIRNEFVCYDDVDYITSNQAIANGLTVRSFLWAFAATGYASNWHPLTWISHAFDNTVGKNLRWNLNEKNGAFTRFVHAENVFIHALNAVLLWLLILLLLAPPDQSPAKTVNSSSTHCLLLSLFCALFWALHPLRVEVVAWAAERKELLSVFFMLMTLVLYIGGNVKRRYSIIAFTLALLAKPVAVSLPSVILFYDLAFRRQGFRQAMRNAAPFVGLSAVACVLTLLSQTVALSQGEEIDWGTRLLCAIESPIVYLGQTLCPVGLSLDYAFPDGSSWPICVLGILLLVAMVVVCLQWLFRRRRRLAVFAVVWAYIGLLPMIGIVKVGYEPHNDRYTYWIGCGISCCIALGLVQMKSFWLQRPRLLGCGCGGTLALLAVLSISQSGMWRNNAILLSTIVQKTHHELATQALAELLVANGEQGADGAAESLLRETLRIRKTPRARAALALHLLGYGIQRKATAEARQLTAEALRENPRINWALAAQALIDYRDGNYASAVENMKQAELIGLGSSRVNVNLREWELFVK